MDMQAIRDAAVKMFNTFGRGSQIIHDEMLGLPIVVKCGCCDAAYRLDGGRFVAFLPAVNDSFDFDPATLTATRHTW